MNPAIQAVALAALVAAGTRHADHTALATPAGATYDAAAIEEQMRLRVISPPLSGDGGG